MGDDLAPEWMALTNIIAKDKDLEPFFSALFFNPYENKLNNETARNLFVKATGEYFSPSQLELYSACPFKHYISYGLHPDEERVFQIDSREAGTVYHAVLEELSKRLSSDCVKRGIEITDKESPWMLVTEAEIEKMVDEILNDLSKKDEYSVLLSSAEEKYKTGRIRNLTLTFAKYMVFQVKKGRICKMFFENQFGQDKKLPAVQVKTSFGNVRIEGTIDRTELLKNGNKEFVKIIDYKTGEKTFSKEKIEAGIDLQLMVYLEAAIGAKGGLEPGGVFYYQVKEAELNESFEKVIEKEISEDFAAKLTEKYALDGLVIQDPDFLTLIDKDIDDFNKPKTDVFKLKERSGYASLISKDDMEKLRAGFRETLSTLCEGIRKGNADINPKLYKNKRPGCEFCEYSSICLKEFAYHKPL